MAFFVWTTESFAAADAKLDAKRASEKTTQAVAPPAPPPESHSALTPESEPSTPPVDDAAFWERYHAEQKALWEKMIAGLAADDAKIDARVEETLRAIHVMLEGEDEDGDEGESDEEKGVPDHQGAEQLARKIARRLGILE